MRAAPGAAAVAASRVIARKKSRRADIAKSPRYGPKVADQGEFRVKTQYWAGLLVAEGHTAAQGA
jgi:hypothetical protein